MRKTLATFVAVAACLSLAACKSGDKGIKLGTKRNVGDDASYSIHAADQEGKGKAIKLPRVYLKEKGYVAVHADAGGAPGPVLGVSDLLEAGDHKKVRIKLEKPLTSAADVWPMIHVEDNNNSTYDFPNGDAPAKIGEQVAQVKMHVTLR
ncbi:MAG: hypothetical protein H0W70_07010 [Actinobacteria bacterium]|nr:hypothetical protein [Actinomycetota bacterium]